MEVNLPIPGLDAYVPSLRPGWLVLVEGGPEPDKAQFVDLLAHAVQATGGHCTILASRPSSEQHTRGGPGGDVVEVPDWGSLQAVAPVEGTTVIDSFSSMAFEAPPAALLACLRSWHEKARACGGLLVVVLDDGVLQGAAVAVMRSMADAVIQFHVRDSADAVQTFVRIPRWGARHGIHQPIHYQLAGGRIALDTRRRHV